MNTIFENAAKGINRNSPQILFGVGVAALVGTAILAAKATTKTREKIAAFEEEQGLAPYSLPNPKELLGPDGKDERDLLKGVIKDNVKIVVPAFAPVVGMGILSIFCFASSNKILNTRNAALAAAYSISEKALSSYKKNVVETMGYNKHLKVMDSVAAEQIAEAGIPEEGAIFNSGTGDTLCYDAVSGRYFRTSVENVRKAEADILKQLVDCMSASLNDFYDLIGIPSVGVGDLLGWTIDGDYPDLVFSSMLDEEAQPCLVMNYTVHYLGEV
jgi:hypothetical protein